MIDLSKKSFNELYKIKLQDGKILKLKKPTQSMLVKMLELSQMDEYGIEVLNDIFAITTMIFNRNDSDITFTQKDIEEMIDLDIAMTIIQDYLKYTTSILGK